MVNKIIGTISKLSLGFVLILIWGFMWIRADILFPVNTESWKLGYILTYLVFVAFIFSFDTIRGAKTEKALFKISFLKGFGKFLLAGIISLVVLFAFGLLIKGEALNSVSQAISNVSIGVILLHAFMISMFEELVFRGWIVERLKEGGINKRLVMILSSVIFAGFHGFMGKSYITMLTYIPLGILLFYVKEKYSPRTNMANSGMHFAFNLFILGFLS